MKFPLRALPARSSLRLLALALAIAPLLTGCAALITSKRKLPKPLAPQTVQTATPAQLVERVNQKWREFESLTATVDIKASHSKTQEGVATDYPSFRGNLLLRKPEMIRILGKAPVVQTTMFDMASDGSQFTLVIPPRNKAYQGNNSEKGTSPNWYENLRPGFLFTAMVVRGISDDEYYSVTSEVKTQEDQASKRLLLTPEYEMSIVRKKAHGQALVPVRIVRFHRDDLLPYEQDLYDSEGELETQVTYGAYHDFDGFKYPSTITLRRPTEDYQLVMTVERVTSNPTLSDDQFQVKIPTGAAVQQLK